MLCCAVPCRAVLCCALHFVRLCTTEQALGAKGVAKITEFNRLTDQVHELVHDRVVPALGAKEVAKLMEWGLGKDWRGSNVTADISAVVAGIRRGAFVPSTSQQAKVKAAISNNYVQPMQDFYSPAGVVL